MSTETSSETSSMSVSQTPHSTTAREQNLEKQIEMLMNTVSTPTRRLDEAMAPPTQTSLCQHNDNNVLNNEERLRRQIEDSVLKGIEHAAVTHRQKMQQTEDNRWNSHQERDLDTEDNWSHSTRSIAPNPPGICSPKKVTHIRRALTKEVTKTSPSPTPPSESIQEENPTQNHNVRTQVQTLPTIVVQGKESEIKLQNYNSKMSYKSWKSDCLLKISLNIKYNNITKEDDNKHLKFNPFMTDRETCYLFSITNSALGATAKYVHANSQEFLREADGYSLWQKMDKHFIKSTKSAI